MFALVDCNNFYASCEKVFNPKLKNKPVVVLSNNDGCIIARSKEAKDLGIPMGAPAFKVESLFMQYGVKIFSANFTLYGDLSNRIMKILSEYTSNLEIYSIDEAFMSLDFVKPDKLTEYARQIKLRILKGTGISVSIGIAPTKTLCKITNHICKKKPEYEGVLNWNEIINKDLLLEKVPVEEVWGIGHNTAPKLNKYGVYNALQFKSANQLWIRKLFSVTILRILTELNEVKCLPLESIHEPRKGIMSSRSFGKLVETKKELREAVATYICRAAEKLRQQKSAASYVYVSIKTNKHKENQPQYFKYIIIPLKVSTWYVPDLIKAGYKGLDEIFLQGYKYKKATVMLLGIVPQSQVQLNIFHPEYEFQKVTKIMTAIDIINKQHGSEFIKYAATGLKQKWRMKQEKRSPRYTTNINEILKIVV